MSWVVRPCATGCVGLRYGLCRYKLCFLPVVWANATRKMSKYLFYSCLSVFGNAKLGNWIYEVYAYLCSSSKAFLRSDFERKKNVLYKYYYLKMGCYIRVLHRIIGEACIYFKIKCLWRFRVLHCSSTYKFWSKHRNRTSAIKFLLSVSG